MPRNTGTVTEVGAGNIQFYIPTDVSSAEECVFDPEDPFQVITVPDVGLLLKPPDATPAIDDLAAALDDELDAAATDD